MKITRKVFSSIIVTALMVLSFAPLMAQKATSMRINEVLVNNQNNFMDQYGHRGAWIELFNSSAGTVDIKGCYLTNDPANLTKYAIPKGDVLTQIKPGQHILFWADGMKDRGTFHLNFVLDTLNSNFIALVDADGKTIIDSINTPATIDANRSYARRMDGVGGIGNAENGWEVSAKVTPSTNNVTLDTNEKLDRLKNQDPSGGIMSITAISVVFIGLILLSILFRFIGWMSNRPTPKKKGKTAAPATVMVQPQKTTNNDGEVHAAIALALYEAMGEMHDTESFTLTIARNNSGNTGWCARGQSMRTNPQRYLGH